MHGYLLSRDPKLDEALTSLAPVRLEDDHRLLDELMGKGADYVLLDMREGTAWELLGILPDYPELGHIPVLLLVERERLGRLWLGPADDFVIMPLDQEEIVARLRLLKKSETGEGVTVIGDLVIDAEAYQARLLGRLLEMTYKEFELLRYLAERRGRVVSREQLLSDVWGYENYIGTRTIDIHIRRLRVKLGVEYGSLIETVRQVGYRFSLTMPE